MQNCDKKKKTCVKAKVEKTNGRAKILEEHPGKYHLIRDRSGERGILGEQRQKSVLTESNLVPLRKESISIIQGHGVSKAPGKMSKRASLRDWSNLQKDKG